MIFNQLSTHQTLFSASCRNTKFRITMISISPSRSPDLTAFNQRLDTLRPDHSSALHTCAVLADFLPRAIAFLSSDGKSRFSEQVAHFLMGKINFLPDGLERPTTQITKETRIAATELLRTNRYKGGVAGLFFGKLEPAEVTLGKLKELHFQLRLENWKNSSINGRVDRQTAVDMILDAQKTGRLWLHDLQLYTMPPLPDNLTFLEIFRCDLDSLHGMPEKMNSLFGLNICATNIGSLVGLPKEMNGLRYLELGGNKLSSLVGLPAELGMLETLELSENQIDSLTGMPVTLNALSHLDLDNNRLRSISRTDWPSMNGLEILSLRNNPLESASSLPNRAELSPEVHIRLHGTPIFESNVSSFDLSGPKVDSLDSLGAEVKGWFPEMSASLWGTAADSSEGRALATLLRRLHGCESFQGENKTASTQSLREILTLTQHDKAFEAYCFAQASGSNADCHDNVQAIFEEMCMQLANPALKSDATAGKVVEYGRGLAAVELIEQYVLALNLDEPLESAMLLKSALSEELKLPIKFGPLKFEASAGIFPQREDHKKKCLTYSSTNLTSEFLAKTLAKDQACAEFFKRTYRVIFAAHNLLWQDALEGAANSTNSANSQSQTQVGIQSLLSTAKNKQYGDGKEFKSMQEKAEQVVLNKVCLHAVDVHALGGPSGGASAAWEVKELANNPDWRSYLVKDLEREDWSVEIEEHWSAETETLAVLLKESGIKVELFKSV